MEKKAPEFPPNKKRRIKEGASKDPNSVRLMNVISYTKSIKLDSARKEASIAKWLDAVGIKKYEINKDLTVNTSGSVDISHLDLEYIPFQFGIINGNFNASYNKLKVLWGSPIKVYGKYNISHNNIKSLNRGPIYVMNTYDCSYNELSTLENPMPLNISVGAWNASNNKLILLSSGLPKIKGYLDLRNNNIRSIDVPTNARNLYADEEFLNIDVFPTNKWQTKQYTLMGMKNIITSNTDATAEEIKTVIEKATQKYKEINGHE